MPVGFASTSRLKSPYQPTVQRVRTRVTVGKRFTVCSGAKNICIQLARHHNYGQVLNLRSRYRRKTKNRLPPKNYRRTALPPKKYRHMLVYRFCQSRYRRKMKKRLPPKNNLPYGNTAPPVSAYKNVTDHHPGILQGLLRVNSRRFRESR